MRKIKRGYKSSIYGTARGARLFPALWHFAEGLFYFYKLFYRKRRILEINVVSINKKKLFILFQLFWFFYINILVN